MNEQPRPEDIFRRVHEQRASHRPPFIIGEPKDRFTLTTHLKLNTDVDGAFCAGTGLQITHSLCDIIREFLGYYPFLPPDFLDKQLPALQSLLTEFYRPFPKAAALFWMNVACRSDRTVKRLKWDADIESLAHQRYDSIPKGTTYGTMYFNPEMRRRLQVPLPNPENWYAGFQFNQFHWMMPSNWYGVPEFVKISGQERTVRGRLILSQKYWELLGIACPDDDLWLARRLFPALRNRVFWLGVDANNNVVHHPIDPYGRVAAGNIPIEYRGIDFAGLTDVVLLQVWRVHALKWQGRIQEMPVERLSLKFDRDSGDLLTISTSSDNYSVLGQAAFERSSEGQWLRAYRA